tara:strand:+ start:4025 stop:5389 length:1365 start_codon:yes stop_codon:yes gene_type:complete
MTSTLQKQTTIQTYGDLVRIVFPEGIVMTFENFREEARRFEGASAEVLITLDPDAFPTLDNAFHLMRSRIGVMSASSKATHERWLSKNHDVPGVTWALTLEHGCEIATQHYRRGEAMAKVAQKPARHGNRFLIDPLIQFGELNLWYAEGGTGKSLLATYASLIVQAGMAPTDSRLKVRQANTLYLDYETTLDEVNDRVHAFKEGMALGEEADFQYRRGTRPLAEDARYIKRMIDEFEIGFVVVDSLGMASGTGASDDEAFNRLFVTLRTWGVTVLAIDHVTKSEEGREKGPIGTVYKWNNARNIWEVKRATDMFGGPDELHISLIHRKANNQRLSRPPFAINFHIEEHPDGGLGQIWVEGWDARDSSDIIAALGTGEGIKQVLKDYDRPMSYDEIAAKINKSPGNVRKTVTRMKNVFVVLDDPNKKGNTKLVALAAQGDLAQQEPSNVTPFPSR